MSTGSLAMGLMGGLGLVYCGGLLWVLTRWGAHHQLGSNPAAGIRTRATTASPEAWVAGHRAALPWARRVGVWGITVGVLLAVTAFLPAGADPEAPSPMSVAAFAIGYGGLLLGCVPLVRTANRAARQVTPRDAS